MQIWKRFHFGLTGTDPSRCPCLRVRNRETLQNFLPAVTSSLSNIGRFEYVETYLKHVRPSKIKCDLFSVFQLSFPVLCLLGHVLGLPMLYEFLSMSWTSTACDLCETNPCSDRWLKLWIFGICSLTHWLTQSVPTELVYYLCSTLRQKQKLGVWNGWLKMYIDESTSMDPLWP